MISNLDSYNLYGKISLRLCKIQSVASDMTKVSLIDYLTSQPVGEAFLLQGSGDQVIPKGGEIALVLFSHIFGRRIIKIWATEEDLLLNRNIVLSDEQNRFNLNESIDIGEVSFASKGGSYLYLENNGNTYLSSSCGINKLSLLTDLTELKTTKFKFYNEDNFKINILDNKLEIIKEDKDNKNRVNIEINDNVISIKKFNNEGLRCTFKIDNTGNIIITSEGAIDITTKGDILLGGNQGVVTAPGLPPGSMVADVSQLKVSSKLKTGA